MSMTVLVAALVAGIVTGSIYALVALGLNVAYRPTKVFNFAHGPFIMVGVVLTWFLTVKHHLAWAVAAVVTLTVIGAMAAVVEAIAVGPMLRLSRDGYGWLITTFASAFMLQSLATDVFGTNTHALPPTPGMSLSPVHLGTAAVSTQQLMVVLISVALAVVINAFYRFTRVGRATLAVAEDREAASLNGINPARFRRWSFVASGAVAGITGIVIAPLVLASTSIGFELVISGFAALALGGVGSNVGAVLGGLFIGLVQSIAVAFTQPAFQELAGLVALLVVLMVLPHGFLGKTATREV